MLSLSLSLSLVPSLSSSPSLFLSLSLLHTVPLDVTSHPLPNILIEGNPSKSFSVNFNGRMEQNIQITWEKDGRPLPPNYQVATTYDSFQLTGSTSLHFSAIQRKDRGVYRVVLESMLGAEFLPRNLLYREVSFQLNVTGKHMNYRICNYSHIVTNYYLLLLLMLL